MDVQSVDTPNLQAVLPVVKEETETNLGPMVLGLEEGSEDSDDCGRPVLSRRDLAGSLDGFVLGSVLSDGQCQALCRASEELRYSFWNASKAEDKLRFRNADTVEVHDPSLAKVLWERVKDHVVPEVDIGPDDRRYERGLDGRWRAIGINEHMLFARYGPGGHFSPHTDGYTIIDFNTRTLYSALVYLNTCSDGGATRMMAHEQGQQVHAGPEGQQGKEGQEAEAEAEEAEEAGDGLPSM
eukprot:m.103512 g.103512  ORF g.103512 m.103512 type:complete len:240 (-) comp15581_c0_seq1:173-892(-)